MSPLRRSEILTSNIFTQVETLAAQGWSDADIAADLGLSEKEVKKAINRCLRRRGFQNRAELILDAHRTTRAAA